MAPELNYDSLPNGYCIGSYKALYEARESDRLTEFEGTAGRIYLAKRKLPAVSCGLREKLLSPAIRAVRFVGRRVGCLTLRSYQRDRILKGVPWKYFNPVELIPMRSGMPFLAQLEYVFHNEDVQDENEYVWISQPYYAGGSLQSYRVTSAQNALDLAAEFAYAIWQLQRMGFIHGDVKPSNVFFTDKSKAHIVLADFGLITPCHLLGDMCGNDFKGTAAYMAPNIWEYGKHGIEYGMEVDWWAFGLTMMSVLDSHCYLRDSDNDIAPGENDEYPIRMKARILTEECIFKPDATIKTPEFESLDSFLAEFTTKDAYMTKLANNGARAAFLAEDPSQHPILGHPYFGGVDWIDVCVRAYSEDDCRKEFLGASSLLPLCEEGRAASFTAFGSREDEMNTDTLNNLLERREAIVSTFVDPN
eukprot:TRINITY_DN59386_c0_g1_i1.p1 TRINITY_DN59386_c0_g1~~TRINITY_DN59386_c0_g1_i1.p1  ORF type:complete len:465 (+),score=51.75 TRINITY_DN59386_c0_g1_i1:144-1397(+)